MPSAIGIKVAKIPFRTKPDHEHDWQKLGEWRKYDVLLCVAKVVGRGNAATKDRPEICNLRRFALHQKERLNKKTGYFDIRPRIFVPVRTTNAYWDMQFRKVVTG